MGTAYLSILEHGVLKGIEDPEVMQYALVVSYVNGAGALLRTFSSDRKEAIEEINDMDKDEFFEHVVKIIRHHRLRVISGKFRKQWMPCNAVVGRPVCCPAPVTTLYSPAPASRSRE